MTRYFFIIVKYISRRDAEFHRDAINIKTEKSLRREVKFRYAWPSGDWGSLPVEGGIEAAYRAELDAAPDRDKLRAEIEERLNRYRSPFRTAETFLIEEIIDPRDTRPLLCEFANLTAKLREPGPVATPMRP